jgi:hypothetical protein
MVEQAAHGGAWATNPPEFNRKVIGFFGGHNSTMQSVRLQKNPVH